jgi:hypothetical protein
MSIHKRDDRQGKYEVRWREGGRQRTRLLSKKGDAQAFELDVKRRRQLGPLAAGVIQSRITLAKFVRDEWWPRYAVPNLKESTRRRYLEVWGVHLLPRLGDYQLRGDYTGASRGRVRSVSSCGRRRADTTQGGDATLGDSPSCGRARPAPDQSRQRH